MCMWEVSEPTEGLCLTQTEKEALSCLVLIKIVWHRWSLVTPWRWLWSLAWCLTSGGRKHEFKSAAKLGTLYPHLWTSETQQGLKCKKTSWNNVRNNNWSRCNKTKQIQIKVINIKTDETDRSTVYTVSSSFSSEMSCFQLNVVCRFCPGLLMFQFSIDCC